MDKELYYLNPGACVLPRRGAFEIHCTANGKALRLRPETASALTAAIHETDFGETGLDANSLHPHLKAALLDMEVISEQPFKTFDAGFWPPEVHIFHGSSQRTLFLYRNDEVSLRKLESEGSPNRRRMTDRLGGDAPSYKYGATSPDPVADLIARRVICRTFTEDPIPAETVADILRATFVTRGWRDSQFFGRLPIKGYPSSGARYEFDLAVVVRNVLGLQQGVYIYDDEDDAIKATCCDGDTHLLEAMTGHQGMASCQCLIVPICFPERIAWKYTSVRGYSDVFIDVGHCLQSMLLHATERGLGTWVSSAVESKPAEQFLNLPEGCFVPAVLGIGIPG